MKYAYVSWFIVAGCSRANEVTCTQNAHTLNNELLILSGLSFRLMLNKIEYDATSNSWKNGTTVDLNFVFNKVA